MLRMKRLPPNSFRSEASGSPTVRLRADKLHGRYGVGFRMPAGRDLSTGAAAGVRKPPRKEPAGAGWAGCRLWGFGWVAAWVGAAPAGVVCVGPTMAVAIWSLRRRSTG